nr:conserved hypothetical protein [Bartonella sp. AR 15-3]
MSLNNSPKGAKMKAVITKPICVIDDNKSTVRFEPSTPNNPFVEFPIKSTYVSSVLMLAKPFVGVKTTATPDKAVEQIKQIEQEAVQTSTESAAEEIPLEQPKVSKVSKPSTPIEQKPTSAQNNPRDPRTPN